MISRRSFCATTASALAFNTLAAQAELKSAKAAGFSMPLETERHARTFMQWPAVAEIYGSQKKLNAVRNSIALIANSIAKFEPVVLLARPEHIAESQKSASSSVQPA